MELINNDLFRSFSLFYRIMNRLLLLVVGSLSVMFSFFIPESVAAQEKPPLQYPANMEDTMRVHKLISKGMPLQYSLPDSALKLFREAERISRDIGFDYGIARALTHAGLVATDLGDYEQGFACYREAFTFCLRAGIARRLLPVLYLHMGVSWHHKGVYTNAHESYYKALSILQKNKPGNMSTLASIHTNLASLQVKLGNPRQALLHAGLAGQIAQIRKNPVAMTASYINKGSAYVALGKPDSAEWCFRSGLVLAERNGYASMEQACLTNIGELLMRRQEYREAADYFQRALDRSDVTHPYYGSITPGYHLGEALFHLKSYRAAERILLASLDKAAQTGMTEARDEAYVTLAALYEATGAYANALQYQRMYQHVNDSMVNVEKLRTIKELELKYETAQKNNEITQKELQISRQEKSLSQKNMLIGMITGSALLAGVVLLGIYRSRRKISARDREIERLRAMMTGEEKERGRISRELHDGIGGMLTGIKMNLKAIQKQRQTLNDPNRLDDIMDMLHEMGREIHKTAHNLMPDILLKHNLPEALQLYCAQMEGADQLQITLQFQGDLEDLDKSLQLSIYRIVQELMQNTVKYAQAARAAIQLRRDGHNLYISVEDDGIGFDQKKGNGLGLQNIETRVGTLNGYFSIESAPGMGTTAYIELDLRKIPQVNHEYTHNDS